MDEKLTLLQRIRNLLHNLFKFKIRISPNKHSAGGDDSDVGMDDLINPEGTSEEPQKTKKVKKQKKPKKSKKGKAEAEGAEAEAEDGESKAKGKKEKKKKEKKAKPKKEKKKKEKKPAVKEKKKDSDDDGGGKKKMLMIVIISVGVVVLAAGAVAVIMIMRINNSPEKRLEKAAVYVANEEYEKATEIYDKLIEERIMHVEAYIAMSNMLAEKGEEDEAIELLEIAYDDTHSSLITRELDKLRPQPEETDGESESGEGEQQSQPEPPADTVIKWSDEAFGSMIRMALGKEDGQAVTAGDLSSVRSLKILGETHAMINGTIESYNSPQGYTVDGVLYGERGGISLLDDLRHFTNLTKLTVAYNSIKDVEAVAGLKNLVSLGLHANEISDITPLGKLTELEELFVYENKISDLSPIGSMPKLKLLYAQINEISDIQVVSKLTNLEELFVSSNNISDITPVSGLMNLRMLYADNNRITDISVVADLAAYRQTTPMPAPGARKPPILKQADEDEIEESETLPDEEDARIYGSLTDVHFVGNPIDDYSPANGIRNVNRTLG